MAQYWGKQDFGHTLEQTGNLGLNPMHKSKRLAFLIVLVTAVFASTAAPLVARAQQQDGLGIAAVVNDDVISALDLQLRTTMIIETSKMSNTPETRARIMPQILRGLIDEKLMLQEARRIGITVDQKDIDKGIERIAQGNKMTVEQLAEQMNQFGVPLSALNARIEAEIAWGSFANRALARTIKISEEEISDEIKLIQSSAGRPEYLLADIYLPVDKPGQEAEVQQLATRLIDQIKSGTPFNALATNFSRSPSAALGGDMGWVQDSHLDPELLNVVSRLRPGDLSNPIRTLGGYYIMLLREVRTSPGLGSGEAILKLSQFHLQPSTPGGDLNAVAAQLNSITQGVTTCAQLDALGQQSGSPMSGPLGEVPLSAMPPEMRAVLESLPAGQLSRPVVTGGGLAILMICERQDQSVDTEAVRTNIANRLTNERLSVAAQRHLRDLRRQAFVDIRL